MQLGFLHRYIFLLIDRAEDMLRARAGRQLRNLGLRRELKTAAAMIATLCLNSIEMAWRISTAMQARGFDGRLHTLNDMRLGRSDWVFAGLTAAFLIGLYYLTRGI
jgi:cobalt/nickel transport system permease protein